MDTGERLKEIEYITLIVLKTGGPAHHAGAQGDAEYGREGGRTEATALTGVSEGRQSRAGFTVWDRLV